ncbi:MT-A70-like [Macleaya cordata]|uniref:MT-A70-like n=1 Tax=Macleaya cordata TaxID=56857 RepID=A0A200R7H7_MACCD|nr:MT-A70-like [Macleaya cordata]
MVEPESSEDSEMSKFLNSGIYRFDSSSSSSNVVFMDPVRVLNSSSYTLFRVSPSLYYSRFFFGYSKEKDEEETRVSLNSKKRKRKQKKSYTLNERERSADQRHQEARPLLLRAHEVLLEAKDLLLSIRNLKIDDDSSSSLGIDEEEDSKQSFIELGSVFQAPFYEISLYYPLKTKPTEDAGYSLAQYVEPKVVPIFNNLVMNESFDDVEAEFLNKRYILPGESCFYMSDLEQIHDLIPAKTDNGFNLIVIDPPWENGSASQKSVYPTLPNRYFLSLPIKQLTHTEGALVALWVTNREKLRIFVEKELFPMWGVSYAAVFYWLKLRADGSLIGELDLFHHRPYECLLLGYCHGEGMDSKLRSTFKPLQENQVIISVPGEYSRKPPVGKLLLDYVPGPKPSRCIELFARELFAGWTSWGNEPLHFQESTYFMKKRTDE